MPRVPRRKLSKKEQKAAIKEADSNAARIVPSTEEKKIQSKKKVILPEVVSIKEYADRSGLPATRIIGELMKNGILATINETIDFETASIIGDDLNLEITLEEEEAKSLSKETVALRDEKDLSLRPPVVTIMGHVDHGKTTLLDKIREAHVAQSESGGITQHITAYQVTLEKTNKNLKNRTITFIDTPGHAAFSAMREHGAAITDIVVLIVAADDGVMPQTIEVIKDAEAHNVPIIVAINKVDLPDADVMKTKQQLTEYNLLPEEWGGKTVMVEVSAKTGMGVDELLEMILLQADMMELKANPNDKAVGVVIDSHMHKGAGAMALLLIENGTLRKGDPISIGSSFGKVRILETFNKKAIGSAGPSTPVRVAGLKSVPNFGDKLIAFDSEKEAKENAFRTEKVGSTVNVATAKRVTSETQTGKIEKSPELNIVLKSDVSGSVEAIKKSFSEFKTKDATVTIVSEGIGSISESDVTLAHATNSIVVGFRVKVLGAAKKIAETEKIKVKTYDVIYELINYIKEELSALLPPEIIEEELGRGEVLAIFRDDKKGFVAGGKVNFGKVSVRDEIKFLQNNNEKYRTEILSLRKEKTEVKEVISGSECGFSLPPFSNIAVGDTFVTFKTVEKKRTIE